MDEQERQKQRNYLLWLLGRQDYSRRELERKLQQRQVATSDINELLVWFEEQGFVDDTRFSTGFVRRAIDKRHGPRRIFADAATKGIAKEAIAEAIEQTDVDWFELAKEAYQRKFSSPLNNKDFKEKAKRMRYLSARGFDYQHSEYALASSEPNDE